MECLIGLVDQRVRNPPWHSCMFCGRISRLEFDFPIRPFSKVLNCLGNDLIFNIRIIEWLFSSDFRVHNFPTQNEWKMIRFSLNEHSILFIVLPNSYLYNADDEQVLTALGCFVNSSQWEKRRIFHFYFDPKSYVVFLPKQNSIKCAVTSCLRNIFQ